MEQAQDDRIPRFTSRAGSLSHAVLLDKFRRRISNHGNRLEDRSTMITALLIGLLLSFVVISDVPATGCGYRMRFWSLLSLSTSRSAKVFYSSHSALSRRL